MLNFNYFKGLQYALCLAILGAGPVAQAFTDEIPITSCAELQAIELNMTGNYYLAHDLDCATYGLFDPIGTAELPFMGTLEGKDFTVSNLRIQNPAGENNQDAALFRRMVAPAQVMNIQFNKVSVSGHDEINRGLIAGVAVGAEFKNIDVTDLNINNGLSTEKDYGVTGGIVGIAEGVYILDVHIKGTVDISRNGFGGGIAGIARAGTVIEYSSVAQLLTSGQNCENANSECGFGGLVGLAGQFQPGALRETTQGIEAVQQNKRTAYDLVIKESYATGKIISHKNIGGLIGYVKSNLENPVHVKNSYTVVELCRNQADCKYAGGLFGKVDKNVFLENVYVAGKVKPNGDWKTCGRAIVGYCHQYGNTRDGNANIKLIEGASSYFDTEATTKNKSGEGVSVGLTTAAMQGGPFSNWDPTIWVFEQGKYPSLKPYTPPTP